MEKPNLDYVNQLARGDESIKNELISKEEIQMAIKNKFFSANFLN